MGEWRLFWDRVVKSDKGCWSWIGGTEHGYGRVWDPVEQRRLYAHQLMYREVIGPLLPGHQIHHVCHNRGCVNPDHLVQLTQSDHLSEHPSQLKTHCKWGHALVPENLYVYGRTRHCKTCALKRARARRDGQQKS